MASCIFQVLSKSPEYDHIGDTHVKFNSTKISTSIGASRVITISSGILELLEPPATARYPGSMKVKEPSTRRGYHHGNLKQALIDATVVLIEARGPTGFTLSEAAKQAGVSGAAPYRHFKGREDLIAEVALQGFKVFADLMEFAYAKGAPSPLASIESVGRAYLAFARKNPGHYIAMFESGVVINDNPELAATANRGMNVLIRAADELCRHLPVNKRPPASMISHHIWAMSHGIVELFARGEPGTRSPFSAEELLESGMGIYLRGLGILPADR